MKGRHHDSEAAVERWLTTPAMVTTKPRADGRPRSHDRRIGSDPGGVASNNLDLPALAATDPANDIRPTPFVAASGATVRGKRLLRERLKHKAQKEERMKQQEQQHLPEHEDNDKGKSALSLPRLDTDPQEIIDLTAYGKGIHMSTTPSTAASTRSSSSRALSVRHAMSGLTLSDSQSPSGQNGAMGNDSSMSPSSRHMARSDSLNEARRGRRTVEVSDASTPHNHHQRPEFSASPRSPTATYYGQSPPATPPSARSRTSKYSSSGGGNGSPRSSVSRLDPPGPNLNDSDPSAPCVEQESATKRSSSGDRRKSTTRRQSSLQESDEEREKVDKRTTQRERTTSSDHRQAHVSSNMGKTNRIKLHVYDLIAEETVMQLPWGCHFPIGQCFNAVNSGLHTLGTGAYHVGIEINGIEYAYGANDTRGLTGLFTCVPKCSPGYQFRTTIDLGDRALIRTVPPSRRGDGPQQPTQRFVDGREVVREMASEYLGADYDLLRKNCVTFAHDACLRLGIKESEVPEWFRNLCLAGAAAQDAANSTIVPLTRVFSSCDMEGFAEIVKDTGFDTGFEVISHDKAGQPEQIVETESMM